MGSFGRLMLSVVLMGAALFPAASVHAEAASTTEDSVQVSDEVHIPIEETIPATASTTEIQAEEPRSVSIIALPETEEPVDEEDEGPTQFDDEVGWLFESEYLALSMGVREQLLTDAGTVSLPLGVQENIQWSYAANPPTPFVPGYSGVPVSFPDALAASVLTFQIYSGEIGSATLLYSQTIPYGTTPDIPFTPAHEGAYIFVLASTYLKDTYPPGMYSEHPCSDGDLCAPYQTRIEDFTFFMEHGHEIYNGEEDEVDDEVIFFEDGVEVSRMARFHPMAFSMVQVSVTDTAAPPEGISNVLFLPGIKGSRLYSSETHCVGGVLLCDERLWEPNTSEDITDLYLNADGESLQGDIYVSEADIIDTVDPTGTKIYDAFVADMNELQASSTHNGGAFKWRSVAYDWRLSLDDIVNNGVWRDGKIYYQEASSTPYIEQTLRELAATSATHKVTIIAHSNGGLVTKALLQKLGDAETAALVDKIIFVGVPQTGAPQALGGLLFGDRENLKFVANAATARGLAENSPMAYHLMPSTNYLASVQDPEHSIIGFSGSNLYEKELAAYGPSIDTFEELRNFLTAAEGGRSKPNPDDATRANVLNAELIEYADDVHTSLDAWVPPTSVELHQIAGWGVLDTISGIDMYDEQKLLDGAIGYKRQYRPIFVEDGDGVVPTPSALMMSTTSPNVHRYWIDFADTKFNHATMLEFANVKGFIQNSLEPSAFDLPSSFSTTSPVSTPSDKRLIFQLHSPLTLGIYDTSGNYTGLAEDGSVSEDIPGTTYGEFGEVKYLIAPAGSEYELVLNGQSDGTFSLDIQEQIGNISTTTTIADVPTTLNTVARLTITSGIADASSLTVDTDGDGETDIEIAPIAGEMTQYVAPVPVVEEISEDSSGSDSSGYIAVAPVSSPLAVITPPATISEALKALKPRVLGASLDEVEIPMVEASTATEARNLSQTASVYNAFSSFAEWFKLLLYNIWKGLLNLLTI